MFVVPRIDKLFVVQHAAHTFAEYGEMVFRHPFNFIRTNRD